MQFKNPEILYFLALLIIPVLVHLFQLQKFVKTPFTNVAFLQKLTQQTRKSSRIKKWLILTTRMLLFLAIFLAFSQPYISKQKSNQKQENFIYLDNSLSLNSKGKKGDLLKIAAQEIIENSTKKNTYTLQTNSDFYANVSKSELKNILINLKNTSKKVDLSTVLLKINNLQSIKSKTLHKNILISDFQNNYTNEFTNVTQPISLIKLEAVSKNNISIDSIFITNTTINKINLKVVIRNQGEEKNNIPITLLDNQKLLSKQSFSIEKNSKKTIDFNIDKGTKILGEIQINFNDTYAFDNTFKFNINSTEKINILSLGKEANFISKIYSNKEFNLSKFTSKNINYNTIKKQQLIVINELKIISSTLQNSLVEFSKSGGNLVIIPHPELDLNSYNSFFKKLSIGSINKNKKNTLKITNINFNHPFFKNVFYKKVQNFQYPNSQSYFPTSLVNSRNLISYENKKGFVKEVNTKTSKIFWIAAALNKENSNFTNSPLIVPVFYNFGQLSLQPAKLYYNLNQENTIEVSTQLNKDEVLSIKNAKKSFIPLQKRFQNKATLTTLDLPENEGFYHVLKKNDTLRTLAFNNPKEESNLTFLDTDNIVKSNKNITSTNSVAELFKEINKKNEVHWLWKWFLALAIVSLLLEILILKFFKS
jgi:hypothetical protein